MTRFRSSIVMAAGATFLAFAGSASAQFIIDPADNYPVGARPDGVTAGDFDGDGDLDIATTSDGTGNQDRIDFLTNNGDETFSPGGSVFLPNSSSPGALVAGDLDGDGDPDLAVILRDFNQMRVVLNNGGSFSLAGSAAVGSNARGLDIADADGDGDIDLVVGNRDSNTATYMANSGAATFTSTTLPAGAEPRAAAFGDFDGDGDMDIAITNHDDRTLSLYRNNGGTYSAAGTLSVGGQRRPEGVDTGDFNGDGLDDSATAANGNGLESATVFIATGNLAFSGPFHYASGGVDTSAIVAADLDCDGDIDLATRNAESHNISLLPNLGAGTFGNATLMAAGTEPDHIAAADLNGDGDFEIMVSNKLSNSISVFINQCATGGGTSADLFNVNLVHGIPVAGGVASFTQSGDGDVYQARSSFGFSAQQANYLDLRLIWTVQGSPATVDLSLFHWIDNPGGNGVLAVRNVNTSQFETISNYSIPFGEPATDMSFPGISTTDRINAKDRMQMRVTNAVIATFSAQGFLASYDEATMTAN